MFRKVWAAGFAKSSYKIHKSNEFVFTQHFLRVSNPDRKSVMSVFDREQRGQGCESQAGARPIRQEAKRG